ncbi:hypothetical protein Hypma_003400 [Hypsizygus marmoreus]|uniref:F-box domain-containing protein n=1 Tax=Hypsizygus marmoreus TaxID=39966 RepID=A0A369J9I0_HYPMA|nr:hypothetical protein Hypma_003400 [Hypsizygus marmoreus]
MVLDLVEDVLLTVLTFCDICSVLAASQVDNLLRTTRQIDNSTILSFQNKYVIALVTNLHRRLFLDLPCGARLDDYSTDELINLVKHIVHGPSSWTASTTSAPSSPIIARQVILTPDVDHGPGILNWENQAQLFPGVHSCSTRIGANLSAGCESKTLVWTYRPKMRRWVNAFALEPTDGGRGALIMIGIRDYATLHKERKNFIEILHLDFSTGDWRNLFDERAPDSGFGYPFCLLRIQGDYAVAGTGRSETESSEIMLFELSTLTTRTLRVPKDHDMDLVSGNLVMLSPDIRSPHRGLDMRLWRMASLIHSDIYASIDAAGPLIASSIELTRPSYIPRFRLAAHASPLRSDHSIIWILASSSSPKFTLIRKYHVSHAAIEPLTIRCTKTWDLENVEKGVPDVSTRISYAGYANVSSPTKTYSLSDPALDEVEVPLPNQGDYVHMSAYSGALTYAVDNNVIVNYYE